MTRYFAKTNRIFIEGAECTTIHEYYQLPHSQKFCNWQGPAMMKTRFDIAEATKLGAISPKLGETHQVQCIRPIDEFELIED